MDTLHLFDAELRYTDETTPVVAPDGREGDLIGSGVGRVTGSLLSGTLGWSFYAADCAYLAVRAGFEHPVDELCRTHPGGEIRTDDGALIRWDARGFGLRGADPARPHRWRMASAIVFDTDDDLYACFGGAADAPAPRRQRPRDLLAGHATPGEAISNRRGQAAQDGGGARGSRTGGRCPA